MEYQVNQRQRKNWIRELARYSGVSRSALAAESRTKKQLHWIKAAAVLSDLEQTEGQNGGGMESKAR